MTASGDPRHELAVAAALLEQGRIVDGLSRLLTAFALVALVLMALFSTQPVALAWLVPGLIALAGLGQAYFALRVGLDAALFRHLAAGPSMGLASFDAAMQRQGLLPAAKAARPIDERIAGARRLFHRQILLLAVQIVSVLAGALLAALRLV
jgi:hypothetical protein